MKTASGLPSSPKNDNSKFSFLILKNANVSKRYKNDYIKTTADKTLSAVVFPNYLN